MAPNAGLVVPPIPGSRASPAWPLPHPARLCCPGRAPRPRPRQGASSRPCCLLPPDPSLVPGPRDHQAPHRPANEAKEGTGGRYVARVPAPPPAICKSNLCGVSAGQSPRQGFNREIFTEGFLLPDLSILISLPLWLNVNFTPRTATADPNTFYLFMAFKILVLETGEAGDAPSRHVTRVSPVWTTLRSGSMTRPQADATQRFGFVFPLSTITHSQSAAGPLSPRNPGAGSTRSSRGPPEASLLRRLPLRAPAGAQLCVSGGRRRGRAPPTAAQRGFQGAGPQ